MKTKKLQKISTSLNESPICHCEQLNAVSGERFAVSNNRKPKFNIHQIFLLLLLFSIFNLQSLIFNYAYAVPTVIATVSVGDNPFGISVNPTTNRIYVSNSNNDNVSVINGVNNEVIATVSVGSNPWGVSVNPTTNRIYVANIYSDNVSVIDGANNTVIETVSVGDWPSDISVNPTTNRIYVANWNSNNVSVIDGVNNTVIETVSVGSAPLGISVNPTTNRIYVANFSGNNVSEIDGVNNTVIETVSVGSNPVGISVNPTTNRIYVANYGSGTVSVIEDIPDATPPSAITEAHFYNATRPGATDIAIGEQYKVTAVATPGLTNLQGVIGNGDVPPGPDVVIGDYFNLIEVSPGKYEYTGTLTTNIDKAGREASKIIAAAGIFEVGIVKIAPEVLTVTTVLPPAEALKIEIQKMEDLKEDISISGIVIAQGLNAKLDASVDSINRAILDITEERYSHAVNMINGAQNQLQAFVNMLSAQSGKKIPEELAQKWITEAQGIIVELEKIKAQLGVSSPASKEKVVSAQADLNADGKVSEADLEVLKKAFNSKPGDKNWNPECDLNGDGKIDLGDFGVLVKEYNK